MRPPRRASIEDFVFLCGFRTTARNLKKCFKTQTNPPQQPPHPATPPHPSLRFFEIPARTDRFGGEMLAWAGAGVALVLGR